MSEAIVETARPRGVLLDVGQLEHQLTFPKPASFLLLKFSGVHKTLTCNDAATIGFLPRRLCMWIDAA